MCQRITFACRLREPLTVDLLPFLGFELGECKKYTSTSFCFFYTSAVGAARKDLGLARDKGSFCWCPM